MTIFKNKVVYLSIIFSIVIISLLFFNHNSSNVEYSMSYTGLSSTVDEMMGKSELILIGRVVRAETENTHGVIFTNYTIATDEVFKNINNINTNNVKVSLTGGKQNGVTYSSKEIEQLNIGDTYLFALKSRWPERINNDLYTPAGAYQGIMKVTMRTNSNINRVGSIVAGSQYTIVPFNSENNLEQQAVNQQVMNVVS